VLNANANRGGQSEISTSNSTGLPLFTGEISIGHDETIIATGLNASKTT
jgi:hypothetical protein